MSELYASASIAIRDDLAAAHARAWGGIGRPGTWWDGPQRVAIAAETRRIHGRLKGRQYVLEHRATGDLRVFDDGVLRARFGKPLDTPRVPVAAPPGRVIDVRVFHTLRLLLDALLDPGRLHPVNAALVAGNTQSTR